MSDPTPLADTTPDVTAETIALPAPDGTAEAYVARPDGIDRPLPGVLLLVDAFGLRDQTRSMADRIASWGYVVLAPNVFYRLGTVADLDPGDLTDTAHREAIFGDVMARVGTLTDDVAERDLAAYLDALQALPGVAAGPVGITGYCMGGRLALLAASTRPDDVAAIGMFHTGRLVTDGPDSPHHRVADVSAAVLAVHADRDHSLPPEAIARFSHALAASGVTHSAAVYPGAPHGYTMADLPAYRRDAAEHHYAELRALFADTLLNGTLLADTPLSDTPRPDVPPGNTEH